MDITKIPIGENATVSLLDSDLDMQLIDMPFGAWEGRELIDKDAMKGAIRLIEKILALDEEDFDENIRKTEIDKILHHNDGDLFRFFVCVACALRIRNNFFENTETISERLGDSLDTILVKENPSIELELGAGANDGRFIYRAEPQDIILHFGSLLNAYNILKDYAKL
ncbi:MAG: hypothetical protein H6850_01020 [Alphaproteobacteria bacterium]|nr:MAG: hypothetical protein H6850_01020 [Alphaproteobacteria bacterium]